MMTSIPDLTQTYGSSYNANDSRAPQSAAHTVNQSASGIPGRESIQTSSTSTFPPDEHTISRTRQPYKDTVDLSSTAQRLAYQHPTQAHDLPKEEAGTAETPQAASKTPEHVAQTQKGSPQPGEQPDPTRDSANTEKDGATPQAAGDLSVLDAAELEELEELKQRDQEVRTHEAAHAAVGGQYAGAPTLEYATGPDGRRYAVSGEVNVDMSKVKGDPQETIDKMEQIQAAALAPAQPSAQDRRVAARAAQIAAQARIDLRQQHNSTPQNGAPNEPEASDPEPEPTPEITIESLKWAGSIA